MGEEMRSNRHYSDIPDFEEYKEGIERRESIYAQYTGENSVGNAYDEAEIVRKIKARERETDRYYEQLKQRTEDNRKYWKGDQVNSEKLLSGQRKIVSNRIFTSIETVVPIATRKTPEPLITVLPRGQKSIQFQDKIGRYLKDNWDITDKMKQQLHKGTRNFLLSGYIGIKHYRDQENQENRARVLSPLAIRFPMGFPNFDESPFVIEYVKDSVGNVKQRYPQYADKLEETIKKKYAEAGDESTITYIEYWEDDKVCWKFEDCFLGIAKNPHFDWSGEDAVNHFVKAKKPYNSASYLSLGENIADETTLVDQVKPLQDSVNRRKTQIDTNADFSNGKWVFAGGRIEEEDAAAIDDSTYAIYLKNADTVAGAIDVFYGRALDQGIYADMADSKSDIDDVMGTHGTTRGVLEPQQTATGVIEVKGSDYGRIDLLASEIEQLAEDYFNYKTQMAAVYLDQPYPIHTLPQGNDPYRISESDRETYLVRDEFKDKKIKVLVKEGSTAPRDPIVEKSEAVQLANMGKLATVDLLRKLDMENPEQLAKNVFLEATDPIRLFPELENPEIFEPEAIRHLLQLMTDENEDDSGIPLFDSPDLETYQRHIETQKDYMRGINIHDDLIPYSEISTNAQDKLRAHMEKELINFEELVQVEEQRRAAQAQEFGELSGVEGEQPAVEGDVAAALGEILGAGEEMPMA